MADAEKNRSGGADLIKRAAVEVFLEVGLRAATTRMVTDRAGVGRGLLNHYFRWPDLRAESWAIIFRTVAQDQFPPHLRPDKAIERYLSSAFATESKSFWLLWLEAADLAKSDPAMATAMRQASETMLGAMIECLAAGETQNLWRLRNARATALRLSALYDGLAGMLLSGSVDLTPAEAEAHLRQAFAFESVVK